MAVAKLYNVALLSHRDGIGGLLAALCGSGCFHPSDREGLVDDPQILELASKAHGVYSEANSLLETATATGPTPSVGPGGLIYDGDMVQFVSALTQSMRTMKAEFDQGTPGPQDREELCSQLAGLREQGLVVFNDLRRIKVFPNLKTLVLVQGYVPADGLPNFRRCVGDYLLLCEPVEEKGSRDPCVPTLLRNKRVGSAFEEVTLAPGAPKYSDIDPTPIVAFVFPLFFGMMFADIGRGLALIAAGSYMRYRMKKQLYWAKLLQVIGISAAAFGAIKGDFFGIAFSTPFSRFLYIPEIYNGTVNMGAVVFLLEVAIVIGILHLSSAYVISVIDEVRSGRLIDALTTSIPTLIFYWSSVLLGLAVVGAGSQLSGLFASNAPTPLFLQVLGLKIPVRVTAAISLPQAVAALTVLILGRTVADVARHSGRTTDLAALGQSLMDAFLRPIEFLANTLSYIRLAVLLITGSILGSLIAELNSAGLVWFPVVIFANVGLIAIEGVIVYVQDLRLNIFEWLSNFQEGTGIPFVPLQPMATPQSIDRNEDVRSETLVSA